ncbi:alpha/beta-hydrolase [Gautieria morchelliformis]|nr:alpha/beta-hydrolase [Gautieria morchelliformis]
MDSVDTANSHACERQASPAELFRIRLATYGVSIIIALAICSVPVLLMCCFVPIVVILALPALSLLLLTLALLIPQMAYLLLAQTDAPPHAPLPFLASSFTRCFKIDRAVVKWLKEGSMLGCRVFCDWIKRKYYGQMSEVRLNVQYGLPNTNKKLDIYVPYVVSHPNTTHCSTVAPSSPTLHPVIVFLPPQTRPFPSSKWLFSSFGLNLSTVLSVMVVIPDLTPYPEGRIQSQIKDARLVLRYVEEHAARYGGDPTQIYFAGHGLGGLLALLLPIQQAVAESRDNYLNHCSDAGTTEAQRIPNGVAKLKVYAGEIVVPKIKGLILFAPITDVDAHILHEGDRGVHHLSIVRRVCGPGQVASYFHSPAHLLYASRSILDVNKLPPKVLFLHGGLDEVVSHEQSETMKEFFRGVGVRDANVRLFSVGHWGIVTSLMFGMDGPISRTLTAQLHQFIYGSTVNAGAKDLDTPTIK